MRKKNHRIKLKSKKLQKMITRTKIIITWMMMEPSGGRTNSMSGGGVDLMTKIGLSTQNDRTRVENDLRRD